MDVVASPSRGVSLFDASGRWRGAVLAVVAIGMVLRLLQYVGSGSLWIDELALARNVVDRGWGELITEPLAFGQVAPIGFLIAQKAAVTAFGSESDFVWRLVPFAAASMSLVLFARLAERSLTGVGALVAVTLFATAVPLLFFATQAKQYSTDVLSSTLIILCGTLVDAPRATRRQLVLCALIGAAMVWLSHPALLVLGGTGLVVLGRHLWRSDDWRPAACVVAVWGASAVASLLVALWFVEPDVRNGMLTFWAAGFPPASMNPLIATRWLLVQIERLIGVFGTASLGYPAPMLFGAFGLLGAIALLWRGRLHGQIVIAVGGAAVVAAVARQYPLAERLALYLLPLVLLVIAAGIEAVHGWLAPRRGGALASLLIAPCLWPLVQSPPPYQIENVHPMLAHLQRNRQPGDRIYVYYGALLAFDFYAARYGFTDDAYTAGACHRPDNRKYLEEIDVLRGAPRVWLFFSHAVPRYRDREDLLGYLDTIGYRRQRAASASGNRPPDVEVYLYDLSDPARLALSDPERYTVRGPEPPVPPCAPRITRRAQSR